MERSDANIPIRLPNLGLFECGECGNIGEAIGQAGMLILCRAHIEAARQQRERLERALRECLNICEWCGDEENRALCPFDEHHEARAALAESILTSVADAE